ncbi:hypothetical protein FNF27_07907 [Cafeteria roenbergensis]|uniref:Amino acid permease/ SLC12A domain-containing protein n=1 Tax=Cafeteria roenbergensis TaxID=33653 RepID=A0A5A8DE77_CAFRO|nr:hypothetical protein FNF27_07907 [Cafeteria roenbergensis]
MGGHDDGASPTKALLPNVQQKLGIIGFALVAFFAVCGGPFGLEAQVSSGGPLLSLASYAALPFLWALPQVVMTAELASRFPEDGGFVVWVGTALGESAALVAGINGIAASTVELAIYPTLVAEYAGQGSAFAHRAGGNASTTGPAEDEGGLEPGIVMLIKAVVVLLALSLNLVGLDILSRVAVIMLVIVVAPFVIALVILWPRVVAASPNIVALPPGGISGVAWDLWLPATLWSFTGWDALGAVAGQVSRPGRTYCCGSFLAVVMVAVVYALPLITGAALHPDLGTWTDGCLVRFARDAGTWVGDWVAGAAVVANFGLLCATLAATSRALWAMGAGVDAGEHATTPVLSLEASSSTVGQDPMSPFAAPESEFMAIPPHAAAKRAQVGYGTISDASGGSLLAAPRKLSARGGRPAGSTPAASSAAMSGASAGAASAGVELPTHAPARTSAPLGWKVPLSVVGDEDEEEEDSKSCGDAASDPGVRDEEAGEDDDSDDERLETRSLPPPDEVGELHEQRPPLELATAGWAFASGNAAERAKTVLGPRFGRRGESAASHASHQRSTAGNRVFALPSPSHEPARASAPLLGLVGQQSDCGSPLAASALGVGHSGSTNSGRILPAIFGFKWKRFGTPAVALAAQSAAALAISLVMDFDLLLQVTGLMASIRLLLEFTAFVQLRRMPPPPPPPPGHPPRFVIPYGWFGIVAVSVPKLAVVLTVLSLSSATAWYAALVVNAFVVLLFAWKVGKPALAGWCCARAAARPAAADEHSMADESWGASLA